MTNDNINTDRVFSIFRELNRIPRPSHHEERIAYDVFTSATRPDVFLICETWTDAASLDKHAATPEFKKYSPMMRQCGEMKVERFEF